MSNEQNVKELAAAAIEKALRDKAQAFVMEAMRDVTSLDARILQLNEQKQDLLKRIEQATNELAADVAKYKALAQ